MVPRRDAHRHGNAGHTTHQQPSKRRLFAGSDMEQRRRVGAAFAIRRDARRHVTGVGGRPPPASAANPDRTIAALNQHPMHLNEHQFSFY